MPRKASGRNEGGRIRQERYRQRLALKAEPEVGAIDTALSLAVAEMLTLIEAKDPQLTIKSLFNRGLTAAAMALKEKGYQQSASVRLLNRRLVALKMGLAGRPKK